MLATTHAQKHIHGHAHAHTRTHRMYRIFNRLLYTRRAAPIYTDGAAPSLGFTLSGSTAAIFFSDLVVTRSSAPGIARSHRPHC